MTDTPTIATLDDVLAATRDDTGPVLIDARDDRWVSIARIPGATPIAGLSADAVTGRDVILYGRDAETAPDAGQAATLRDLGAASVRIFPGGFREFVAANHATEPPLRGWACTVCSYGYHPSRGDSAAGVAPGTLFEEIRDDWRCPWCGAAKASFYEEPPV
jgi:rubredoxin/rhodanese-related sulfurtransferase